MTTPERPIALGLGLAACQKGLSVGFTTAAALVSEMMEARDERRIEETLCLELLGSWAEQSGLNLETGARGAAPRYVREAERLMAEQVHEAPTVTDIATQLGISTRSLSEGFRRFRGITPHDYLTARRLDGLRKALQEAPPGETVSTIAAALGYVNLTAMTVSYRRRFGESPHQTLRSRPKAF